MAQMEPALRRKRRPRRSRADTQGVPRAVMERFIAVRKRVCSYITKGPSPMKQPELKVLRLQASRECVPSQRVTDKTNFTVVAAWKNGATMVAFVRGSPKAKEAYDAEDGPALAEMARQELHPSHTLPSSGLVAVRVLPHAQATEITVHDPQHGCLTLPMTRYAHFDSYCYLPRLRNMDVYSHRFCVPDEDEQWPVWAIVDVSTRVAFMWCYESPLLSAILDRRAATADDCWLTVEPRQPKGIRTAAQQASDREAAHQRAIATIERWHPTDNDTDFSGGRNLAIISDIAYGDPPPEIVSEVPARATCPWLFPPESSSSDSE